MSREDPQMKIRLPVDLKDSIEQASKEAGRSMNAEIVARLENSFLEKPGVATSTRELMAMAFFAGAAAKDPGQSSGFVELLDRMFPADGTGEIEDWLEKARADISRDQKK